MCGIAAIHLVPRKRTPAQWQRIQKLFTENLLANEERGREASGIALISNNKFWLSYKGAAPASLFIRTSEYKKILNYLNEKTVCILGHTRKATKGEPRNDANNHPIHTGDIIGVHNGIIKNDDELFAKYQYSRIGEVDSEIIFQLINAIDSEKLLFETYITELKRRITMLRGDFTFLFVDLRFPNRLFVIKKNKPMALHWDQELEVLFFSSRYLFLRKTFGSSVIHTTLPAYNGFYFDSHDLSIQNATPTYTFHIKEIDTLKC